MTDDTRSVNPAPTPSEPLTAGQLRELLATVPDDTPLFIADTDLDDDRELCYEVGALGVAWRSTGSTVATLYPTWMVK